MEENLLVTVIIPVYKVEKYLEKCVQSVLQQTYHNLEIILVDDGSPDNSGKMCDDWKVKDNRIVVIHKKNGGLSSARNAALDICTGEYIYFLDSDDYIKKETIEIMIDDAQKTGAQIVEANFMHVYDNKQMCRASLSQLTVMYPADAIKYDLSAHGGTVSSCSKLFNRYIFSTYRFLEGKLNEDHFSIVDLLSKAETIAIDPRPLYYYVHRKNSITTSSFSKSSLDDLEAAQRNYELIRENYPEIIDVAEFRIDISTLKVIDKIMLSSDAYDEKLLHELVVTIRKNKTRIIRSNYFTTKRKFSVLLLLTNIRLYRVFVKENARRSWSA